jgi:thioredoxin 1
MKQEVHELSRDKVEELVTESRLPVIIDFWGPQCRPCLALEPIFFDLADRYNGRVSFLRAEAPKNRMLCVDMKVMTLPTFLYVVDGVEVSRLDGDVSATELAEWVQTQNEISDGGE